MSRAMSRWCIWFKEKGKNGKKYNKCIRPKCCLCISTCSWFLCQLSYWCRNRNKNAGWSTGRCGLTFPWHSLRRLGKIQEEEPNPMLLYSPWEELIPTGVSSALTRGSPMRQSHTSSCKRAKKLCAFTWSWTALVQSDHSPADSLCSKMKEF